MPLLHCPVASAVNNQGKISIWLVERRSQSILPHANGWGPCRWTGRWIRLQGSTNPDFAPSLMIPLTSNSVAIFQPLQPLVGARCSSTTSDTPRYCRSKYWWSFPWWRSSCVLLGTPRISLDLFFQTKEQRIQTGIKKLFDNNNNILPPRNENTGGSAVCIHWDFLPDDAIVTHMITCQGRYHVEHIQSGQNFVIVIVHFEPELNLLRERLRLITPQWPSYPNAVSIILSDLNIFEPEEGRFNVRNQTFHRRRPEKDRHISFVYRMSSRLLNLITRGGTPNILDQTHSCKDWSPFNKKPSMAEARDFHRTWRIGPLQVITRRYVSSFRNQHIGNNRANANKATVWWPPFRLTTFLHPGGSKRPFTLTEHTWQHRSEALNRLYCFACLQK